jgi:BASS family bile acid:Na+ symporter
MTATHIISLAIVASIILTVFALGLDAGPKDLFWLLQRPGLLALSILSMNVFMVIFAVALTFVFHLAPAVKIAVIALALSPVPPALPRKAQKTGGTGSYAIGLVVSAALLSVVLIPGWLELLGSYFHFEVHLALDKIIPIVLEKILAPLVAGTLVAHFAPKLAAKIVKPVSIVAAVLLIGAVLPVLFFSWHAMWAMIGNGVLIAMVLFALAGILLGHFLGGPDADIRSVLALASSARHPGIAMAIAVINFPRQKSAILIVILFHLIISAIIAIPYMKWRKRHHAALAAKGQI